MEGQDYSDVGNPMDVYGNDEDDLGDLQFYSDDSERFAIPPVSNNEVVEPPPLKVNKNSKILISEMTSVCDMLGCPMDQSMINQIVHIGKTEQITRSDIIWYVRGHITATNMQVMPKMSDAIADLRAEIRHMQTASNALTGDAQKLSKQADRFSSELNDSSDKISETFVKTIRSIADYAAKEKIVDRNDHVTKLKPKNTEDALDMPVISEQVGAAIVEPVITEVSRDEIISDKKRLLRLYRVPVDIIKLMTDSDVDEILNDDIYSEVKKVKTSQAKQAAYEMIQECFNEWCDKE